MSKPLSEMTAQEIADAMIVLMGEAGGRGAAFSEEVASKVKDKEDEDDVAGANVGEFTYALLEIYS